ncbi:MULTISPECIES: nucleotidyltransferase domain-containing protein [unclassified Mesorhizobium]|uniref:GSU2403 family nucleotidyltransferase fold protein n=1 Tax=unclassified Mesorhizobium TaxID=325217 RepID=UPI001FE0BC68|nr:MULTISPECIES: nucleotidyltransferase domain-containing protein [unclassified Mesorhizobium]
MQQFRANRLIAVDVTDFIELNNDQRREKVNSDQRFAVLKEAQRKAKSFRGSLVWHTVNGIDHLMRSYYDSTGARHQKVEGRRSPASEALKADWEVARASAQETLSARREQMERQSAVNRALRLGRVPLIAARIIRAIDDAGLLGEGIRIAGTNAIYAYEATAGVFVDPGITSTEDIGLLMDAPQSLRIMADTNVEDGALINLLRKVDRSFERSSATFRAVNRDGYLVDLIKPLATPEWKQSRQTVGKADDELVAVEIAGLAWLENAPAFEAIAIDEKGGPLRLVVPDPRIFAAHKFWVSKRADREPIKRRRDLAQAQAVAGLTTQYLKHLPYEASELRALAPSVFDDAHHLFA